MNPATPLGALEEVLSEVDYILVMTVNPGFGGQKFLPSALQKIRKLRELLSSKMYRARIEVDGGVEPGNLHDIMAAGADMIVAGSAIFKSGSHPTSAVQAFKELADRQVVRPE